MLHQLTNETSKYVLVDTRSKSCIINSGGLVMQGVGDGDGKLTVLQESGVMGDCQGYVDVLDVFIMTCAGAVVAKGDGIGRITENVRERRLGD